MVVQNLNVKMNRMTPRIDPVKKGDSGDSSDDLDSEDE
jgi:hypothetical protein